MYNSASHLLPTLITDYLGSSDPLPQDAQHVIGDGDFRAIGAEFLTHLVRLGGLTPRAQVLDAGCGFGRVALPLTRYLAPEARYLGFDIVQEPIDWCSRHVAPLHSGFHFACLDVQHPLYNQAGRQQDTTGFRSQLRPALAACAPDFVCAISLFTHLDQPAITAYLADIAALLPTGGTLFFTAFLTGPGTPRATARSVFPPQRWQAHGPQLTALIGAPLTAAVGIDSSWLLQLLDQLGLRCTQLHLGFWRDGSAAGSFQDILVCRKHDGHA